MTVAIHTTQVDRARQFARKVARNARDKNEWRKIVKFRLWMPVALQVLLIVVLLWYTETAVRRIHQPGQPHHGSAPGDAPRAGRHRPDARDPRRVSGPVGRGDDQLRCRRRVVPDRRRRLVGRDPVRDRGDPRLRPRSRVGQRRADQGFQDPVTHRHVGNTQHPGRDLADHATHRPGDHQRRPGVVPQDERGADPHRVHSSSSSALACSISGCTPRGRVSKCARSVSTNARPSAAGSGPTGFGCARSSSRASSLPSPRSSSWPARRSVTPRSGARSRSTASPPRCWAGRRSPAAERPSSGARWPPCSSPSSSPHSRSSNCHPPTAR